MKWVVMIVLTLLLATTQLRSRWRPLERHRVYRMTELLGRWSAAAPVILDTILG